MMKNFPKGGLIGKTVRLFDGLSKLQIPILASSACYFLALAVFPALVLLISLIRYTPLEIDTIFAVLQGVVPDALMPYAEGLILSTYNNASGALVSVSALTALWSASRGIHGLLSGLNVIYDVVEDRNFFLTRIISVGYTFAFLIVLLLTLVLHVFGNTIVEFLRHQGGSLLWLWMDLVNLRFFLLVAVQSLLFCVMFMYLPGRNNGFRESLPGALFSSVGWMGVSYLFSVYVEGFSGYTSIFGPVYAVALIMLWLYVCVSMVFYGAVLNRILVKKRNNRGNLYDL
jgi:membrane protein